MSTDPASDAFLDDNHRLIEFLTRHGAAATRTPLIGRSDYATRARSEQYAAVGYRMRRKWNPVGGKTEMDFTEIPLSLQVAQP